MNTPSAFPLDCQKGCTCNHYPAVRSIEYVVIGDSESGHRPVQVLWLHCGSLNSMLLVSVIEYCVAQLGSQ